MGSLTTLGRDVKPWITLLKKSVISLRWTGSRSSAVELQKNQGFALVVALSLLWDSVPILAAGTKKGAEPPEYKVVG